MTEQNNALSIVPGVSDLEKIGALFENSGVFGCTTPGQGFVIAMTCIQSGMTPLKFVQTYNIIEGKPSMRSDAMLSRLLELGGSYEIVNRTPEVASIKATFREATGTFTLTWEEAQEEPFVRTRDGKLKKNWASPRVRMQMLWARAVSDAVRTVCPLANGGSYTPEEIQDFSDHVPPRAAESAPAMVAVAAKAAEAIKSEPVEVASVNPDVMPVGKYAGQPWSDFTEKQLQLTLATAKPEITDAHKVSIRAELERREKDAK